MVDAGGAVENQGINIHQYHTGKVEDVEFGGAPLAFHGGAQRVVADQRNDHKQNIAVPQSQGVGDQPPDLSAENQSAVEAKKTVERGITGHRADQIHNGIAERDIEHQVGDSLTAVHIAEPFKISA